MFVYVGSQWEFPPTHLLAVLQSLAKPQGGPLPWGEKQMAHGGVCVVKCIYDGVELVCFLSR